MIHSKYAGKLMRFKSLNFTFQWTYLSDYVTSLASSYSRVSKNRRGHFISVSRRLPGYPRAAVAPALHSFNDMCKLKSDQHTGLVRQEK